MKMSHRRDINIITTTKKLQQEHCSWALKSRYFKMDYCIVSPVYHVPISA